MKAITISQPYASLIASGEKWIENRTWPTDHRGPLAIHAGSGTQYLTKREIAEGHYPTGKVVATCELIACVRLSVIIANNSDRELRHERIGKSAKLWWMAAKHEHAEGPWCWILDNIVRVDPAIDATGKQGIWWWEAAIEHQSNS